MANTIINGGASPYPKHVGPAAICSFSDGAQDAPLKSLAFTIEPNQSGSGDPSPSNIRPITGWSQVDAWQAAANQIASGLSAATSANVKFTPNSDGSVTVNGTATGTGGFTLFASSSALNMKPGQKYYIRMDGGDGNLQIQLYNNGTFTNSSTGNEFSWTVPEDSTSNYVRLRAGSGMTFNNLTVYPIVSLVSNAPFTPPNRTPITIPLGQTVYGGYEDAIAGKMTLTHAFVEYTGASSENWTRDNASRYDIGITGSYKDGYTRIPCYCNMGKFASSGNNVGTVFLSNSFLYYYQPTSITTLADFRTWLASNHLQVVYQLATPIEIDLTPVSVSSLLGQNNIWANTGDTELDYYPAAASVVAVLNRSSKVYTSIPLGKIRYDTYQTTPNQALDLDSYRAETGVLIRNVLSHTATKIEFNTPSMTNAQWEEVWNIIKAGFNNSTERKLKLKYYDQMSATYKTGWFYVPDVQFTIRNIDEAAGIINYDEVRVAFIEY